MECARVWLYLLYLSCIRRLCNVHCTASEHSRFGVFDPNQRAPINSATECARHNSTWTVPSDADAPCQSILKRMSESRRSFSICIYRSPAYIQCL
ncbi:hypothetical protein EDB19DRAFT_1660540 [Suillus lakei]|nr:hypothetical protein EDB19DRAFT_1660540 [Suillus lakei]